MRSYSKKPLSSLTQFLSIPHPSNIRGFCPVWGFNRALSKNPPWASQRSLLPGTPLVRIYPRSEVQFPEFPATILSCIISRWLIYAAPGCHIWLDIAQQKYINMAARCKYNADRIRMNAQYSFTQKRTYHKTSFKAI